MASAEAAPSSSLGPRYAPPDPTLPNPWKGLIDGGTGILYYWNPETNVTQYDRPVSGNPPLPLGLPPMASSPNMASLPMVGSMPLDASAMQQQQKPDHPAVQQPQSMSQQMTVQNSQPLPYCQTQPIMNQQIQQQYPQLQSNQIQCPPVSYFLGQLMGQSQGQLLQQQAPQVPSKQQQEGSQVLYQQQQGLQTPYQQQPHQQGSQFSGLQQQQLQGTQLPFLQHQQLQGSHIPFQQQQQLQGSQVTLQLQQQQETLVSYQQQPQQRVSKIPFRIGQPPQVSQTSHHQGQQQPEGSQVPLQQQQGFQLPLHQQQQESLVSYQQQPQQQPLHQQQQQQQESLVSYQQQPQQQESKIPFQMGQPPQVPQTSHQQGQQQPEGSQVQQQQGFQVALLQQQQQKQQESLVLYQQHPQQQVSKVLFQMGQPPQVPQTSYQQGQQLPDGSQVPLQQQQGFQVPLLQKQQQESLVLYQQHPQQQVSKVPFQMGQPPQVPQTSQQQGQQQPEGQQIASLQQQWQLGFLRPEELVQQEGKQAGRSVPQVQRPSLVPSNHQLSGPATQMKVSQGGLNSVQPQQYHFRGQSSGGQQFPVLPSGGHPLSGLSSAVQQFSDLSSGGEQFNETSAGSQHFRGLSSGGQHFRGLPSGGQPFIGQNANVSSVRVQAVGTDTTYQLKEMSSPMLPNQVGHSLARPMGLPIRNEEDRRERLGNESLSSSRNEGTLMPKLAPFPQRWNLQDTRTGSVNHPFVPPSQSSELNLVPGRALRNQHNHPPFLDASPTIPLQRMFGAPEFAKISAAVAYRQQHEVTAMGNNIPAPFTTFESTGFPPEILREMHLAGFLSPTPIQAQTWPVALQSRDVVAIAKTGSGKTLGYLIPALILLRSCRNNPQFGPTVLVLAPTRELATQIQNEAIKFGRSSRVSCACLYGGAPKGPQLREIERGADIVIATPGRLNDILDMKRVDLSRVSLLVLDEADRMLDMGFEPQIRMIVNEIPKPRQTLMYTATWPKEVRKIAGDLLVNPVQVNIGSIDELAANKSITQHVEMVPLEDKQQRLEQILRSHERGTRILIFCSTKRLCDQLARGIGRTFGAASIHGDKSQDERDYVLSQFRCGKAPILVATDVAARGLDIKDIRVVINYDFPMAIEDYVHRIGRTGRAGATGVSYTFFSHEDWKYAPDLIKVLEGANQWVPPEIREMAARGGPGFSRTLSRGGISRWNYGGGRGSGQRESDGDHGGGMRDIGGVGRTDLYGERGSMRGREVGGPSGHGGPGDRDRHGRESHDRYYNHSERRGRFSGRCRRGYGQRGRDRSYSRSPDRVRTRGYGRSRSGSQSRSLSQSRSRSRTRSPSRTRSWSRSRSRSRSCDRYDRPRRKSLFSDAPGLPEEAGAHAAARLGAQAVLGFEDVPLAGHLSPMSPGRDIGLFPRNEIPNHLLVADGNVAFAAPEIGLEPGKQQGGGEL